jgi:hypothetical protein
LPTTIVHDEASNSLVITVDLKALARDPQRYMNNMYVQERDAKTGKNVRTDKVKGFNILGGIRKDQDFATVVRIGDTATGIRISKGWGMPSAMSFTVCAVETAEEIMGTPEGELADAAAS